MKKALYLALGSTLLLGLASCNCKKCENTTCPADTTQVACDTTCTDAEVQEEEITIEKGIYIYTGTKTPVLREPREGGKKMRDCFEGNMHIDFTNGEYLEATGEVENGFAKVSEHLHYDQSEKVWEKEYGWVPAKDLEKVDHCPPHSHDPV